MEEKNRSQSVGQIRVMQVFRSITETGSKFKKTIKTELSCPSNQITR